MASNCEYVLKIVGRDKEAVMQAAPALRYKDFNEEIYGKEGAE